MKHPLIHIILLMFLLLISACEFEEYKFEKGVMDLTQWDPETSNLIKLKGECEFYWNPRFDIDDFYRLPHHHDPLMVPFPYIWNGTIVNDGKYKLCGKGFGAFHMKIVVGEKQEPLAFKIPYMFSAYRMFINGKLVAKNGKVTNNLSSMESEYLPVMFSYFPDSDTLDLVIQVENYKHYKGGIWRNIILGSEQKVHRYSNLKLFYISFILGILIILGVFHIYLYLHQRREVSYLILGIISLLICIRTALIGEIVFKLLFPNFDWALSLRIEYISLYLAAGLSNYFIGTLFPEERPKWFYGFTNIIYLMFMIIAFMPVSVFTHFFIKYANPVVLFSILIQIYILWKAYTNKRDGATLFMFGMVVVLVSAVNDTLFANEIIRSFHSIHSAMVVLLLLQSVLINRRTAQAFATIERQRIELDKYRDHLENMVTERTRDLRESEARFRAVSDNAPVMICSFDKKGRCIYWNDQCEQIFGYSFQEIEKLEKLDPKDWNPAWIDKVHHPDDNFSEFILYTSTGEQRRQLWASYQISEGQTFGIGYDVTERYQYEKQVLELNQYLASIIDNADIWLAIIDKELKITMWNQAAEKITGYSSQIVLNSKSIWQSLFPNPDRCQRIMDNIQQVFNKGINNEQIETVITIKNKQKRRILWNSSCLLDEQGSTKNIIFMGLDITDKREAEHKLLESQQRYKLMVENSKLLILDFDYKQGFLTWDGAIEDIVGRTPDKKLDIDSEEWVKRIHPEDQDRITQLHKRVKQRSGKYQCEYRFYNETMGYINVEETGVSFTDHNNNPVRLLLTLQDVTNRRISQEMMLQNEKMASVGTLAAGVAHEINNPLAGISQNVQLLNNRLTRDLSKNIEASEKAGIKFKDLQKYLAFRNINEIIHQTQQAVSQAVKIVKNMLNFTRKSDSTMGEYSIKSLMDDAIELSSSDFSIDKGYDFRKIQISRKYDEDLKPAYCDRVKIQQVLINILKNGAEAMTDIAHEKGYEPKFEIVIKPEDEYIRIEIANNGPPISDSVRNRIFEPFFTTKEVGNGTGLGLSVSYYIITKDHRGQMFLEKGGNKETRFVILLPQNLSEQNSE